MGTGALTFTGLSSFSADFQTILTREVAIAQLPLKALQNREADLLQKKQLLVGFNTAVADVGSSISALGTIAAKQALGATSSDSTKVSVVNSGASSPATYTISNITSVAAAASETTTSGYATSGATPVSANGTLSLVLGSQPYAITLGAGHNNLLGLRDAINNSGAGVTASILTTGTGANPNYLTISANATGQTTLQLNDAPVTGPPVDLLSNTNQGTNAVFQLNGASVSHTTNSINDVISGLTFTILGKTAANQTVSLSLSSDRTQLGSALQDFAGKYNNLVDQVNSQVGPAAGLLSGDFLISQVESDLQQTSSYQGARSIKGIANLGISLSSSGKATFDQTAFNSLSDAQVADAFAFLGSATTGFGSLAQKFTQLSDPASGLIQLQQTGYTLSSQRLTNQINQANDRISNFQKSISARLQQADALLASLQSQQQVLTASVQSVNLALYGKGYGSSNG